MAEPITLTKKAKVENVNEMVDWALEQIDKHGQVSAKTNLQLRLICEEILVNISSYAYLADENGEMTVNVSFDDDNNEIIISFTDFGKEFNPLAKEDPDINQDAMERQIGGLGIFTVKKFSDDVSWERENNMNKLTIKKAFDTKK